jgi:putative transposase
VEEIAAVRAERAQKVALWRHQLIREAADPPLTTRRRGPPLRVPAEKLEFGATLKRKAGAHRRADRLRPEPDLGLANTASTWLRHTFREPSVGWIAVRMFWPVADDQGQDHDDRGALPQLRDTVTVQTQPL